MTQEVLKLALEGVEIHSPNSPEYIVCAALIEALRENAMREVQRLGQEIEHDYRTRYDRGCYKCGSHYCPADCPEPLHLVPQQPEQEPVKWPDYELDGVHHNKPQQEPVTWEQFYPDIGKPQIEQPKVRTGDCLLVGVCASEGHKIQAKQEQEEYLSKAYRLANELRCHLAIAPAPQRTWVGLTDEEKDKLDAEYGDDTLAHLDAIEAKLKQKNGFAEEKNT